MLNIQWLNPRLYQILQTRYKYLRVAQAFKNQFSSEKTYSKKAKTRAGESRNVSLYLEKKLSFPGGGSCPLCPRAMYGPGVVSAISLIACT